MTKYSLRPLRLVLAFALLVGQLTHAASPAETMMSTLFDGPPRRASENLHMDAYVEVRLQKLAKPRIAYINWSAIGDMLRRMGYANPPTELTPELAKAILDRAGFAGRVEGEPAEAYLNEFRTLWAIRYGGHLINWNFGAGRNAAGGMLDWKGVVRTILVRPWADAGHSDGTMAMFECMKEAYWSNILHQILPHGANRVVFIMTTGTSVNKAYSVEDRAVAYREDPERPAYWQPNLAVSSENMSEELRAFHMEGDRRRMERLLPTLTQALPMPKNFPANATAPQRLRAGLFEFIDRLSHQYTTAYARQVSLAGASTSNTEFSKALDFGSTSGLIGYPRAQLASGEVPNGTPDAIRTDIVLEFAQDLRTVLPPELLAAMPSDDELTAHLETRYQFRMIQNFLELAGAPKAFSENLAGSEFGRRLGQILIKIAQAGNVDIVEKVNGDVPGRSGTYNLEKILGLLVSHLNAQSLVQSALSDVGLIAALSDSALRIRLVREFSDFFVQLKIMAHANGISDANLVTFMNKAVKTRNQSMDGVRETTAWYKVMRAVGTQFHNGDPHSVQNFLDQTFENNVHEFKSSSMVLETSSGLKPGATSAQHSVLDLRTGITHQKTVAFPGLHIGPKVPCEITVSGEARGQSIRGARP